jgi:hypothetical protein
MPKKIFMQGGRKPQADKPEESIARGSEFRQVVFTDFAAPDGRLSGRDGLNLWKNEFMVGQFLLPERHETAFMWNRGVCLR